MVQEKIEAFRHFAGQLASQVVEQLCIEFEREVATLWNDVVIFRTELERVEELLGAQLQREKKLHGVIEQMLHHSANLHDRAQNLAKQQPRSEQMRDWVDEFMVQHSNILKQTVAGVGQATRVLSAHAANAHQLKADAVTAENEYARIANLLSQPLTLGETAFLVAPRLPAPRSSTGILASPRSPLGISSPRRYDVEPLLAPLLAAISPQSMHSPMSSITGTILSPQRSGGGESPCTPLSPKLASSAPMYA